MKNQINSFGITSVGGSTSQLNISGMMNTNARVGTGGNESVSKIIMLGEYYSKLFAYAPTILTEAVKTANKFERFKLTIKFAFSIMH